MWTIGGVFISKILDFAILKYRIDNILLDRIVVALTAVLLFVALRWVYIKIWAFCERYRAVIIIGLVFGVGMLAYTAVASASSLSDDVARTFARIECQQANMQSNLC